MMVTVIIKTLNITKDMTRTCEKNAPKIYRIRQSSAIALEELTQTAQRKDTRRRNNSIGLGARFFLPNYCYGRSIGRRKVIQNRLYPYT
jgi:hypothetical protein